MSLGGYQLSKAISLNGAGHLLGLGDSTAGICQCHLSAFSTNLPVAPPLLTALLTLDSTTQLSPQLVSKKNEQLMSCLVAI